MAIPSANAGARSESIPPPYSRLWKHIRQKTVLLERNSFRSFHAKAKTNVFGNGFQPHPPHPPHRYSSNLIPKKHKWVKTLSWPSFCEILPDAINFVDLFNYSKVSTKKRVPFPRNQSSRDPRESGHMGVITPLPPTPLQLQCWNAESKLCFCFEEATVYRNNIIDVWGGNPVRRDNKPKFHYIEHARNRMFSLPEAESFKTHPLVCACSGQRAGPSKLCYLYQKSTKSFLEVAIW